jgi:transcriptional regulator with XRE-family HTH domain
MNHNELREKALKKPRVAQAYKELEPEYSLLKRMLLARKHAGLSQSDVAKRMGTKPPAIVRLERSLSTGAHSPSVFTLSKYAEAVNCRLDIKLIASK